MAVGYAILPAKIGVATKGGITEEGVKVIHEHLPKITDELFYKTLEKSSKTTRNAQKLFSE